ncbi:MAG: xylose isomerase [Firmicutes bacterium HGW-Firmicutes-2]|nr:MAG: xylose isomerase [Firmicutes bacterium HGW-Firmicutes-2]
MADFKIGVIVDSFKLDLIEGIKKAAEIGAEGIQMYAAYGDTSPSSLTGVKRRALKNLVYDHGMVFSAMLGELGGHGLSLPWQQAQRIELLKRVMDLGMDLGTKIVTTHIGVIPEDTTHERYKILQEACHQLSEYGHEMGGYFAIETGPERTEVLGNFLRSFGSKAMCVNYDPANLIMVTGDDPVLGINHVSDYIVHTHAKDGIRHHENDPEFVYGCFAEGDIDAINRLDGFQELPLGQGDVNYVAYLKSLKRIGYNGFLTIERECGDQPAEDIKIAVNFLKDIMKKI